MNYTQKEMADFLNISYSLYQKLELGEKPITINTIKIFKNKEDKIKEKVPLFTYNIFLDKILT